MFCHSLDGATLFSKVDSNKILGFNVKNQMTLFLPKMMQILSIFRELQAVKHMAPLFGLPWRSNADPDPLTSLYVLLRNRHHSIHPAITYLFDL